MLLLLACTSPDSDTAPTFEPPPPPPLTCLESGEAISNGTLGDSALDEVSGVVESRVNDGVLWVHNDSGDDPLLYAISTQGALRSVWRLANAPRGDWEDLAVGVDPESGGGMLYVGDIGDNSQSRESIAVYRVPEPVVIDTDELQLIPWDTITLTYPGEAFNAETLLLDPLTDDLYVVTKDYAGATRIFRKAAPHVGGESAELEWVTDLDFASEPLSGGATTAGSISLDGRYIVIRTYGTAAYIWLRDHGQTVAETFAEEPCAIRLPGEQQGETIGFAVDGQSLWSISEGLEQPVYTVPLE